MTTSKAFTTIAAEIINCTSRGNITEKILFDELPNLTRILRKTCDEKKMLYRTWRAHPELSPMTINGLASIIRNTKNENGKNLHFSDPENFRFIGDKQGNTHIQIFFEPIFRYYTALYPLEYAALLDIYEEEYEE